MAGLFLLGEVDGLGIAIDCHMPLLATLEAWAVLRVNFRRPAIDRQVTFLAAVDASLGLQVFTLASAFSFLHKTKLATRCL